MSSSLRRGVLAAALALSIAPLAACGAGNNAQTLQIKPDNAATSVGNIQIENAVVLTKADADGDSAVSATVFNEGSRPQTIKAVKVGSKSATLSGKDGGKTITVPAHGSVLLGGEGNPSVTVPHSGAGKRNGDFQNVTFDFSSTGAVTVQALVRPAIGYFESFGPTAAAGASATAPAAESPSPTGTATATATATETVSPTATEG